MLFLLYGQKSGLGNKTKKAPNQVGVIRRENTCVFHALYIFFQISSLVKIKYECFSLTIYMFYHVTIYMFYHIIIRNICLVLENEHKCYLQFIDNILGGKTSIEICIPS